MLLMLLGYDVINNLVIWVNSWENACHLWFLTRGSNGRATIVTHIL